MSPRFRPGDGVRHLKHGTLGTIVAVIPRDTDLGVPAFRGRNLWSYHVLWIDPPTRSGYWSLRAVFYEDEMVMP